MNFSFVLYFFLLKYLLCIYIIVQNSFIQIKSQLLEEVGNGNSGIDKFYNLAHSLKPVTDKTIKHRYQIIYGRFLMPLVEARKDKIPLKFLEIGLGCNMQYGSGTSTQLWQKLLGSKGEIWMGEYDAECVKQAKLENKLNGINVLVGDQANYTDLTRWVKESGGNFDVIIDDGGHHTDMIWHSFQLLWPTVKPGGFYFIEDLEHAFKSDNIMCGIRIETVPFSFVIQHWINMLHSVPVRHRYPSMKFQNLNSVSDDIYRDYPLPKNLESISCSSGACIFIKCNGDINYYGCSN